MLELLVGGGGRHEQALSVASPSLVDGLICLIERTYPAVKRPTILVPAIVAWQMGMTSCNSASKTLFVWPSALGLSPYKSSIEYDSAYL